MTSQHPGGYPRADDAPAFIAPALDLQRAVEAAHEGQVEDAVAFTLAFPIEERVRDGHTQFQVSSADEAPPTYDDSEDTVVGMPAVYESEEASAESTIERDSYKNSGEVTLVASERETLTQNLLSLGPFDGAIDFSADRSPQSRVVLGRARAIRFRLALLQAWPDDRSTPTGIEEDLDLLIHPAVIVALADGAPADPDNGIGGDDLNVALTLVDEVRARLPQTTRATLREAGAAAFARVTLLGIGRAVDYVRERFAEWPSHARRGALAVATKLVGNLPPEHPRAMALRLLREAIG